jgi:hypothetical protein
MKRVWRLVEGRKIEERRLEAIRGSKMKRG